MLISCPECERKVSDRAKACPDCAFPISEWKAEQAAGDHAKAILASLEHVGEVDCPACAARGFITVEEKDEQGEARSLFSWCEDCAHSGRVQQCRSIAGYYAVALASLEAFMAGEIGVEDPCVHELGEQAATKHRYTTAGDHHEPD